MGIVFLGDRAGGCTEACSEGHTYSWPCYMSLVDEKDFDRLTIRVRLGKLISKLGARLVQFGNKLRERDLYD